MSARVLPLLLHDDAGLTRRSIQIDHLVIAGWTGRDPAAVEKHIAELEALGVKRPATTPIFYRVSAARLTTNARSRPWARRRAAKPSSCCSSTTAVCGSAPARTTPTAGRDLRRHVSKQMCDKPMAPTFWAFDEVAPHWDRLMLRSHVTENGKRTLYQEGSVTAMLDPLDLIGLAGKRAVEEGTLMFCGTLSARGGVRPSGSFEFELEDPVLAARSAPYRSRPCRCSDERRESCR